MTHADCLPGLACSPECTPAPCLACGSVHRTARALDRCLHTTGVYDDDMAALYDTPPQRFGSVAAFYRWAR